MYLFYSLFTIDKKLYINNKTAKHIFNQFLSGMFKVKISKYSHVIYYRRTLKAFLVLPYNFLKLLSTLYYSELPCTNFYLLFVSFTYNGSLNWSDPEFFSYTHSKPKFGLVYFIFIPIFVCRKLFLLFIQKTLMQWKLFFTHSSRNIISNSYQVWPHVFTYVVTYVVSCLSYLSGNNTI